MVLKLGIPNPVFKQSYNYIANGERATSMRNLGINASLGVGQSANSHINQTAMNAEKWCTSDLRVPVHDTGRIRRPLSAAKFARQHSNMVEARDGKQCSKIKFETRGVQSGILSQNQVPGRTVLLRIFMSN